MGISISYNNMNKDYSGLSSNNPITPKNPSDLSNPYEAGSYGAQLWDTNPYRNTVATQTFWDKVANAFGVRSGFDKMEQDRIQSMKQYDAQIEQLIQENKYNSPAEQLQRAKEAGLNPDSTGAGLSTAEGSGFDMANPDFQSAENYKSDFHGKVGNLFNYLLSALNGGISLGSFSQSSMTNELTREGINISNDSALISLADQLASVMPSAEEIFNEKVALGFSPKEKNVSNQRPYDNYAQWVIYHAQDAVNGLHVSKESKEAVKARLIKSMMAPDVVSKFIDSAGNLRDSRSQYKRGSRDPFAVDSDYLYVNQTEDIANKYIDKVNQLGMDLAQMELEFNKSKAQFNIDYWKNRSGSNQAAMEEARILNDKFVHDSQEKMAKAFNEIIEWLYGVSTDKSSNWMEKNFARGTLASLFATQNNLMPSLPSFSFDNSEFNKWTRKDQTKTHNFKFRLGH